MQLGNPDDFLAISADHIHKTVQGTKPVLIGSDTTVGPSSREYTRYSHD